MRGSVSVLYRCYRVPDPGWRTRQDLHSEGRCKIGWIVSKGGRESWDVWLEVSIGLVTLIPKAMAGIFTLSSCSPSSWHTACERHERGKAAGPGVRSVSDLQAHRRATPCVTTGAAEGAATTIVSRIGLPVRVVSTCASPLPSARRRGHSRRAEGRSRSMRWFRDSQSPLGAWLRTLVVLGLVFVAWSWPRPRCGALAACPPGCTWGGRARVAGSLPPPPGAPGEPDAGRRGQAQGGQARQRASGQAGRTRQRKARKHKRDQKGTNDKKDQQARTRATRSARTRKEARTSTRGTRRASRTKAQGDGKQDHADQRRKGTRTRGTAGHAGAEGEGQDVAGAPWAPDVATADVAALMSPPLPRH